MSADQLNLRLDPKLVKHLEDAAKRFGFRGKNSAAADIIETYYDNWRAMQEEILELKRSHLAPLNQTDQKQKADGS